MKYDKYYEKIDIIDSPASSIFAFADNHKNFSSHMNTSSWMMGGGKMQTKVDEANGRAIGSHITMTGNVFGFNLYLDEVITIHDPPNKKEWKTVGRINLLVIDHYALGFEITPEQNKSQLKVYISYNYPKSWKTQWLGYLFANIYAKWCVKQMIHGVKSHYR